MEITSSSFDWLRNLWFYTDIEIRATSYAITAVLLSESCGRDALFSVQNRLEEGNLLAILLDEDECSLVKEQVSYAFFSYKNHSNFVFILQVSNVLINLTYSLINDETKLSTGVNRFMSFILICLFCYLEFVGNTAWIDISFEWLWFSATNWFVDILEFVSIRWLRFRCTSNQSHKFIASFAFVHRQYLFISLEFKSSRSEYIIQRIGSIASFVRSLLFLIAKQTNT